jgi:hypothetical protein
MGASASCKMSYCLRVISLRCGSRSDRDVASSIARRRLEGPEEAVAEAVVGMKATPLRGPDHLGPELISERLVTGSILVASDLPELVFPPVSALCAGLRSLSVMYITDSRETSFLRVCFGKVESDARPEQLITFTRRLH